MPPPFASRAMIPVTFFQRRNGAGCFAARLKAHQVLSRLQPGNRR